MSYKKLVFCLIVLIIALNPAISLAKSAVWKVQQNNNILYLAGTIHLLTPQDIPLPREFRAAFDAADTIVLEADVSGMSSPAFQQKMLAEMQLENGLITDVLSPESWQQLSDRFKQLGVDARQLAGFKISFILLSLTMMEMQKAGFTEPGVDARYHQLALEKQKRLDFLETPEEQLRFLLSIDSDDVDELVKYTLNDLDSISDYLTELKAAWRNGDLKTMQKIGIDSFKQDYPNIYKVMLTDRNKAWMKKIQEWMTTPETEAIYVGVLHMAGEDGLLQQLRNAGFQITQL